MKAPTKPACGRPQYEPSSVPGVISKDDIYRLDEACRRLGWTQAAYRAARRRGLRVLASGKRRYLTGAEIFRFLTSETAAQLS
jgi:hypothetical protein